MDQPDRQPPAPPGRGADDEQRLIDALRRGEDAAYERIVRQFGPRMLVVARRFLRQEQDAQDAVQDAFLSAFKSIDNFAGNARFSTWLHRIVVNASLMKIRSRQRKPERSIEDLLPKFDDTGHREGSVDGWAVDFDTAVHDRELREQVRSYIDQLPENYRTVLLLRDIEERTTQETADLLGISPGAVKTRLHRARLALRELMHPQMTGPPV